MEDKNQWGDIVPEESWACGVLGADGFRHCVRFCDLKEWSAKQDQLRAAGVTPEKARERAIKLALETEKKLRKRREELGITVPEDSEE